MNRSEENKRTLKEDISILKRGVKLIEKYTPHFFLHTFLYAFYDSVIYVAANYITASIIDEITGERNVKTIIFLLSLYAGEILLNVLRGYSWRKIRVFNIISNQWEEVLLNNKSFSMDYKNMEDPMVRAKRQMITDSRKAGGLGVLMEQLMYFWIGAVQIVLCTAISLEMFFKHSAAALSGIEKVVDSSFTTVLFFLFLAVCSIFEYKITRKYNRLCAEVNKRNSFIERILHYYLDDYLDDSKACKDIRVFNQKLLIHRSSSEIYQRWKKGCKKYFALYRKKNNRYNVFYIMMSAATYLYVALKTYVGAFGLGGFVKYQFCVARIVQSANLFSVTIASLRSNNDYLLMFFDYLETPTEMHYGTIPTEKRSDNVYDIEFHHVSFKYPNTESYAIKNLSFKFKVGERIAVVGMNGSGKTTMIKLLCRLYDPTDGYITLNGIDIRKYDYEDYLSLFAVVFQDFRLFSFSVGENIAADKDYDEAKVWNALLIAGMKDRVSRMPKELGTSIYKDFDENGVEISGGEAQKLAIARALYKDAPFVILDEPTASLDPLAEYEIYSHFNDMVKDKTAVYISHRLSSCRFCDKIAVFHEGELIQFGSHEKLLESTDEKYYELWNAQAQYYQRCKAEETHK